MTSSESKPMTKAQRAYLENLRRTQKRGPRMINGVRRDFIDRIQARGWVEVVAGPPRAPDRSKALYWLKVKITEAGLAALAALEGKSVASPAPVDETPPAAQVDAPMPRYEVIESRHWKNTLTGATASLYGAVPYQSDAVSEGWEVVTRGFTIRDNVAGTIGIGRTPFDTREEAQAVADVMLARGAPPSQAFAPDGSLRSVSVPQR